MKCLCKLVHEDVCLLAQVEFLRKIASPERVEEGFKKAYTNNDISITFDKHHERSGIYEGVK
jgi:hypothetical protein